MRTPSSTFVEQAPEKREHGNVHHNVPESRCGSSDDGNLSPTPVLRHNEYHKIAENTLPTEVIRYIQLYGIGSDNPGDQIPLRSMKYALGRTRNPNLRKQFYEKTLITIATPDALLRTLQHQCGTIHLYQKEMSLVRDTIDALLGKRRLFPCQEHSFLTSAQSFFDVQTAVEAAEGILSEKQKGELTWSKAMRFELREDLLKAILDEKTPLPKDRREYVPILERHHLALDRHVKLIDHWIQKLSAKLRQHGRLWSIETPKT